MAPKGSRSEADFAACCYAAEQGIPQSEVWAAVCGVGKFKEAGERYFLWTWESAEKEVRSHPRRERSERGDNREPPEPIVYPALTGPELDSQEYSTTFLVEGVLPQGHHTILGGPQKALKTLLACDLAVSLANGGRFLGYFDVPQAVRVAYMSGENGLPILQESFRRIAHAAGTELNRLDNLLVTDKLPRFGHLDHVEAMGRFIRDNGLALVAIDPAYLAMPADDSGNVFAMGELLRGMGEIFVATGCTLLLLHHTVKVAGIDGEPLDLNALSWAGFREFAAAWLLVSRRQRYEPGSGNHKLWLSVGGRAGDSGLFGVDVAEGVYRADTERTWEVDILTAEEARRAVASGRERARSDAAAQRLADDCRELCGLLARGPLGRNAVREAAPFGHSRVDRAWAALVADGAIVPCGESRGANGHAYTTYELSKEAET
jgi:hypothetical protein